MASHSSWRAEDLLDLERCGLVAELALANLGPGASDNEWGQGNLGLDVDVNCDTYDMSEVLDNLLDDKNDLELPLLGPLATPIHPSHMHVEAAKSCETFEVVLMTPSAYGIKTDQEKVTYLNRGHSYEIKLQHSTSSPVFYKGTLSLSFCELRWRNSEKEHFDQWSRDHPCDRLLEIDSIACDGLRSFSNDDSTLNRVHFAWAHASVAVLAIKINCLSTEFAAKKHGGEKGVPLRLHVEMSQCEGDQVSGSGQVVYQGACGIKVFKDKGGDRKQRQDQSKVEKLPPYEQAKYHMSDVNTRFTAIQLNTPNSSLSCTPYTSKSDSSAISLTPGASPYALATPPQVSINPAVSTSPLSITACCSVEDTQKWLLVNRFGQYCILFANYTGTDLMCLSRKDLMDLCGHADGIRLYNSIHSRVLRTLYIRFMQEDKVYQAVCLEELTTRELLMRVLDKLVWLDAKQVSSFVRLTGSGLLVRVDDALVQGMQDEDSFLLQTVKEENGTYQVVLGNHTPPEHGLSLSLAGTTPRHSSDFC